MPVFTCTNSGLTNSFLCKANREIKRGDKAQKVGFNKQRTELTSMSLSAILTGRGGRSLSESRPVTCWRNAKAHTLLKTLASTSRLRSCKVASIKQPSRPHSLLIKGCWNHINKLCFSKLIISWDEQNNNNKKTNQHSFWKLCECVYIQTATGVFGESRNDPPKALLLIWQGINTFHQWWTWHEPCGSEAYDKLQPTDRLSFSDKQGLAKGYFISKSSCL